MRFHRVLLLASVYLLLPVTVQPMLAEDDLLSIERIVKNALEQYLQKHSTQQRCACEQEFRRLSLMIEDHNDRVVKQHQAVIEKITVYQTNLQQMADAIKQLNVSVVPAIPLDLRKQMDTMMDELHPININAFPTCCGSLIVQETNTYYIRPYAAVKMPFQVLCDFEDNFHLGGGWNVFQSRFDGSVDFFHNWTMYKNGFGDVSGEHWLGLDKLHALTRTGKHELLVLLEDFEGNSTYAHYADFKVGSEAEKYKLTVGRYSGTAGDSLTAHNGMSFSTLDEDNDEFENNCAWDFKGGWWFNKCHKSHLNGKYYSEETTMQKEGYGLIWNTFKGNSYSLKTTKMMVR